MHVRTHLAPEGARPRPIEPYRHEVFGTSAIERFPKGIIAGKQEWNVDECARLGGDG